MTLQQLLYFKTVSETCSYTVAAQTLFVSQSVISHAIADLEAELGVPLLVRQRGKKAQLSAYGRRFLAHVDSIFETIEQAEGELVRLREQQSTEIVTVAYSWFTAMPVISELLRSLDPSGYPGNIRLVPLLSQEKASPYAQLLSGDADLAFSAIMPGGKLEGVCIARQELVLLVNRRHRLARRDSVTIQEIAGEPLIGCAEAHSPYTEAIQAMFQAAGSTPNFARFLPIQGSWLNHLAQVAFHRGIAIVPQMAANARDTSTTAVIALDDPQARCSIYLAWEKERTLSPAANHVKTAILDYCAVHPVLDALYGSLSPHLQGT